MDAVDVVRGGGAVRYGPQNVGGIVNFVTRAIPEDFATKLDVHSELSPSSSQDGLKTTHNVLIGGTGANGLGGALLYSGTRGGDWREHSDTRIDDLILKGRFQPSDEHAFSAMTQYYDGEADMPGGLGTAAYRDDPYQSTRPYDKFWGRRTLASASYEYTPNASQKLNVTGFFTKTLRSGYLDQGRNLTLSPREYWVRGLETRFSQGFELGESRHEVGIGHRYVNEASHELRYWTRADSGQLPSTGSRNDRDTRGSTEANAFYIDDRIDIGNWTITPGIRYEKIDSEQKNLLKNSKDSGRYNASLPALNVTYHLTPSWNLYANTEGSFGTVQYSQMGKAVRSGDIEPEKART
ncbi:Fe(3+) dicitrate transport protein FecA [Pseudomonas aeruginosa]|nr:Fe(3+) dicitrate transport protein FecA [Pseudomonas aeruginosa]